MDLREVYEYLEEDYEDVLTRIGDGYLVEKYVREFTGDDYLEPLKSAYEVGKWEDAYRAAHSLMGLALNLGFRKMALSCEALAGELKRDIPSDAIEEYMMDIEDEYDATKRGFEMLD